LTSFPTAVAGRFTPLTSRGTDFFSVSRLDMVVGARFFVEPHD